MHAISAKMRVISFWMVVFAAAQPAAASKSISTPSCTHNNFLILEAVLPSLVERSLTESRSPEARATAAFLASHRNIKMRIGVTEESGAVFPRQPGMGHSAQAAYSPFLNEIIFAHELIHLGGSDEQTLIESPALLQTRIRRILPTVIHEVSHARSADSPSALLEGAIEEEYIAFYRQMAFIQDQLALDPNYLGMADQAVCARATVSKWMLLGAQSLQIRALATRPKGPARAREARTLRLESDRALKELREIDRNCPQLDSPEGNNAKYFTAYSASPKTFEKYIDYLYAAGNGLSIYDPDFVLKLKAKTRKLAVFFQDTVNKTAEAFPSGLADPVFEAKVLLVRSTLDHEKRVLALLEDPEQARSAIAAKRAEIESVRGHARELRIGNSAVLKPFAL